MPTCDTILHPHTTHYQETKDFREYVQCLQLQLMEALELWRYTICVFLQPVKHKPADNYICVVTGRHFLKLYRVLECQMLEACSSLASGSHTAPKTKQVAF